MDNLIPREEVYIKNIDDVHLLSEILISTNNVVMISKEENGYIVNWINTTEYNEANRNGVIFINRLDFDEYDFENQQF